MSHVRNSSATITDEACLLPSRAPIHAPVPLILDRTAGLVFLLHVPFLAQKKGIDVFPFLSLPHVILATDSGGKMSANLTILRANLETEVWAKPSQTLDPKSQAEGYLQSGAWLHPTNKFQADSKVCKYQAIRGLNKGNYCPVWFLQAVIMGTMNTAMDLQDQK